MEQQNKYRVIVSERATQMPHFPRRISGTGQPRRGRTAHDRV